jgi:hypothetical protein
VTKLFNEFFVKDCIPFVEAGMHYGEMVSIFRRLKNLISWDIIKWSRGVENEEGMGQT